MRRRYEKRPSILPFSVASSFWRASRVIVFKQGFCLLSPKFCLSEMQKGIRSETELSRNREGYDVSTEWNVRGHGHRFTFGNSRHQSRDAMLTSSFQFVLTLTPLWMQVPPPALLYFLWSTRTLLGSSYIFMKHADVVGRLPDSGYLVTWSAIAIPLAACGYWRI